ncbi:MAG: hypothetical protein JNM22_15280 [Saprospiraceae bacterium]|nr:hypothetical protein [Saprospiraceae bacterium]
MRNLFSLAALLFVIMTNPLQAQNQPFASTDSFYVVVRYAKVLPGMGEAYTKLHQVWAKVLQDRQAKGEIMYWRLYKRSFPMGTDASYDYISVIGHRTVASIESYDALDFADFAKGLSKEDADIIMNSNKVRNTVSRSLFKFKGSSPQGKEAKYLRVMGVEAMPGKGRDYLALLQQSVPLIAEAIKSGKLMDRTVWQRVFPNNPDLNDFAIIQQYKSLSDAVGSMDDTFVTEFKKIYPYLSYDLFQKQFLDVRKVLSMELWEQVDGTK